MRNGHPDMIPHIVLTHGRSGSNFIVNVLNQHPNVVNYGEVLGKWTHPARLYRAAKIFGAKHPDFLDWMLGSPSALIAGQSYRALSQIIRGEQPTFKRYQDVRSAGIKDFAFLFERLHLGDYLQQRDNVRVIYLLRRNSFKRYLSLLRMSETGVVKVEKSRPSEAPTSIRVDVDDLLRNLEIYASEIDFGETLISQLDQSRLLRVEYEDYFSSDAAMQRTNADVFRFLGVQNHPVRAKHQRINTQPLDRQIVNFDEVASALEGEGFGCFLDDM